MDLKIMAPWQRQKESWNSNNKMLGKAFCLSLESPTLTEHKVKRKTLKSGCTAGVLLTYTFVEYRDILFSFVLNIKGKVNYADHFCLAKALLYLPNS